MQTSHSIALAVLAIIIILGFVLALNYEGSLLVPENLNTFLTGLQHWAPFAVIGLMVVHCFVPFPAEILAISAGALFGAVYGTVLIWVGAMIGALLSFWLARRLGRGAVETLLPERHRSRLDTWTADQGAFALLISRFVPILAFNLINYAAGLSKIGVWTFVWTTAIGILPLTFLMAYMGEQMRYYSMTELTLSGLIVACVLSLLYWLALRKGWLKGKNKTP